MRHQNGIEPDNGHFEQADVLCVFDVYCTSRGESINQIRAASARFRIGRHQTAVLLPAQDALKTGTVGVNATYKGFIVASDAHERLNGPCGEYVDGLPQEIVALIDLKVGVIFC